MSLLVPEGILNSIKGVSTSTLFIAVACLVMKVISFLLQHNRQQRERQPEQHQRQPTNPHRVQQTHRRLTSQGHQQEGEDSSDKNSHNSGTPSNNNNYDANNGENSESEVKTSERLFWWFPFSFRHSPVDQVAHHDDGNDDGEEDTEDDDTTDSVDDSVDSDEQQETQSSAIWPANRVVRRTWHDPPSPPLWQHLPVTNSTRN